MTESIIHLELFPKNVCKLDIIVVQIDSDMSSMPLSLIILFLLLSVNEKYHVLPYHHFLSF